MTYLLDTHVVLWWLEDARELSQSARRLIADSSNVLFVSAVTIWELRIKQRLQKLSLPANFAAVLAAQAFEELSITHAHAHAVDKLPAIHRDPFDRMLIAQAKCEHLTLVTHDALIKAYDVVTMMV